MSLLGLPAEALSWRETLLSGESRPHPHGWAMPTSSWAHPTSRSRHDSPGGARTLPPGGLGLRKSANVGYHQVWRSCPSQRPREQAGHAPPDPLPASRRCPLSLQLCTPSGLEGRALSPFPGLQDMESMSTSCPFSSLYAQGRHSWEKNHRSCSLDYFLSFMKNCGIFQPQIMTKRNRNIAFV